jgi:hypothetical protein
LKRLKSISHTLSAAIEEGRPKGLDALVKTGVE